MPLWRNLVTLPQPRELSLGGSFKDVIDIHIRLFIRVPDDAQVTLKCCNRESDEAFTMIIPALSEAFAIQVSSALPTGLYLKCLSIVPPAVDHWDVCGCIFILSIPAVSYTHL